MRLTHVIALVAALLVGTGGAPSAQQLPVAPDPEVITDEPINRQDQKLQDILARQRGEGQEREPSTGDTAAGNAAGLVGQVTRPGAPTEAEVWEALRFGTADIRASTSAPQSRVLIQPNGVWWQEVRNGPLQFWGGWLLLAVTGLLTIFFLIRGRIRIESGRAGVRLLRFTAIERFGHWLLAVSFLLLAFSGLITLFGRKGLIPLVGHEAYAALATVSKWIHNNVAWAFMIGLVMVFVFWVIHNIPNRGDWAWLKAGGGMVGHGHPPAKKFNAGQKLIFWSVIILGASVSVSGLSLLFPFELPMFAKTFGILNDVGVGSLMTSGGLPDRLAPHEEMQYAQLWHAIIAFVLMAVAIAHIYIGTLGMEGAFEAMGSGEVDLNWAREHHSLWAEEKLAHGQSGPVRGAATPAE